MFVVVTMHHQKQAITAKQVDSIRADSINQAITSSPCSIANTESLIMGSENG